MGLRKKMITTYKTTDNNNLNKNVIVTVTSVYSYLNTNFSPVTTCIHLCQV